VAVASAGPYARHHSIFTGRCYDAQPQPKCQSTEGSLWLYYMYKVCLSPFLTVHSIVLA